MLYSLIELIDEFKATGAHNPEELGHFIRENYVQVYDQNLEFIGYEVA